ncbi:hypothetical protein C0J52_23238 [Blattella germanica]|nr:hypothetical protein C0J52_23238 [Blattella germanica]
MKGVGMRPGLGLTPVSTMGGGIYAMSDGSMSSEMSSPSMGDFGGVSRNPVDDDGHSSERAHVMAMGVGVGSGIVSVGVGVGPVVVSVVGGGSSCSGGMAVGGEVGGFGGGYFGGVMDGHGMCGRSVRVHCPSVRVVAGGGAHGGGGEEAEDGGLKINHINAENVHQQIPWAPIGPSDFWLLHQRLSSGQTRLLEKRSQWPCNHGVDVVKNVYGCREIPLRSDTSFTFFVRLVCEKKKSKVL